MYLGHFICPTKSVPLWPSSGVVDTLTRSIIHCGNISEAAVNLYHSHGKDMTPREGMVTKVTAFLGTHVGTLTKQPAVTLLRTQDSTQESFQHLNRTPPTTHL